MVNNSSTAVHVAGLRVTRGDREVLKGIDVDLERGLVTGLLGPSGSGKSTFIRSIVGVQAAVSGTIDVLGFPAGSPRLRRLVGYLTQSPSVYEDLTVRENLRYFGAVLGAPSQDTDRVLAEVSLADHADSVVSRLSGGQQSRASLAVALLGSPQLLVLDEPTVGLDPVLRRDLWNLFHRMAAEGMTILVSSHVMDEATRCDRLLLIRDGRLLANDDPTALLRRTGAADMEAAFLRLCDDLEVAA